MWVTNPPTPVLPPNEHQHLHPSEGLIVTTLAPCPHREHVLVVPRDAASVRGARRSLADGLAGSVPDTGARDDALLVLSELLGNAVRHAAPVAQVEVRWHLVPGALHLEVVDAGGGEPYLPARGDDAMTGRGMAIVAALSDSWGTSSRDGGRRAVWALIPLRG